MAVVNVVLQCKLSLSKAVTNMKVPAACLTCALNGQDGNLCCYLFYCCCLHKILYYLNIFAGLIGISDNPKLLYWANPIIRGRTQSSEVGPKNLANQTCIEHTPPVWWCTGLCLPTTWSPLQYFPSFILQRYVCVSASIGRCRKQNNIHVGGVYPSVLSFFLRYFLSYTHTATHKTHTKQETQNTKHTLVNWRASPLRGGGV